MSLALPTLPQPAFLVCYNDHVIGTLTVCDRVSGVDPPSLLTDPVI
jgi:hypothetical protein